MNRRDFIRTLGFGIPVIVSGFPSRILSNQHSIDGPNIVFIMSDDHALNSIGCYDSWLKEYTNTPAIDRLASEGIKLNNFFCNNSLCAPARATLITGQYCHTHGVKTLREDLDTDGVRKTLPTALQEAGYQTAVFGKWHVHGNNLGGYDDYGITVGQGSYIGAKVTDPQGNSISSDGKYVSDFYTDISLDWLGKRDKTKPFFLQIHHKACHSDWIPAPRHEQLYENDTIPEPPTFWDDFSNRAPGGCDVKRHQIYKEGDKNSLHNVFSDKGKVDLTGLTPDEQKQVTYQRYIKDYLRCGVGIDENVDKVYKYLESEDILDDTMIIYTSDHGMFIGEHGYYDKRMIIEESLKSPFLVRYPKEIPPGIVSDALINNVDIAQTILDYAVVEEPGEMQGISFRNILKGDTEKFRDRSFYSFYSNKVPKHFGLRTDTYKIVAFDGGAIDLYDLSKDPNELNSELNSTEYADIVEYMISQLLLEMQDINISFDQLPNDWPGSWPTKATGLIEDQKYEEKFKLKPPYPNPFNPSTKIEYFIPTKSTVKALIFNVKGQKIKTLMNNYMSPGWHSINWNGRDDSNRKVSTGNYVFVVINGVQTRTEKLIYIK